MPHLFQLTSEYLWLLMLGYLAIRYLQAKKQLSARECDRGESDEAQGLLSRFAIAAAIPWVLMGSGHLSGATPTIWYYFRPQDGNPFVLAWLATCFLLSAAYAWWVMAANGATKVRDFNLGALVGLRSSVKSERGIKFFALSGPVFFLITVVLVISWNVRIPH